MKRQKYKIPFIILIVALFIAPALAVTAFAAEPVAAPGGEASAPEQIIAALGGDVAAMYDGGVITLLSDVKLAAPLLIKGGEYSLSGAGCHIVKGFDGGFMIELSGDASLTVGNVRGNDGHPSQTFNTAGVSGGAIKVGAGATLTVYPGTLFENFTDGPAVTSAGTFQMAGGQMLNCGSASSGGALVVTDGVAAAANASFTGNTATSSGGAVHVSGGELTLSGCSFTDNSSEMGGALSSDGGKTVISACSFENNTASKGGGGIYAGRGSDIYFSEGIIYGCKADEGGAVYIGDRINLGSFTFVSGEFTMNEAKNGGGVYNIGKFNIVEGRISTNTASDIAGGVYNDGQFEMTGGSVSSNKSEGRCGGIFNSEYFSISDGGVSSNKAAAEFGLGVENWRIMELSDHAFISFNNDVLIGGYNDYKGTGIEYRALVIIESALTANSPVATFTPVWTDDGGPSANVTPDYKEGQVILSGEPEILEAAAEKLAVTITPKSVWTLGTGGELILKHGGEYKPLIFKIVVSSIIIALSISAIIINIIKRRKNRSGIK